MRPGSDDLSGEPARPEDPLTILADRITTLTSLMEEQNSILRRRDQRKDASDKSRQPIPEVPATSGSAWNALLRSAMADFIQPKADGWRSGLDALLVFLGLFSAIVTAFIVPSLGTLQPDQMARTNEILSNITSIMIAISAGNGSNLNLTQPSVFVPAASDVRFNVYLTLSLIISLSIGALAIACRGFLNLVSESHHTRAVERLTEIRTRWKAAENLLGPAIESLPQLLIIPVLLFILGLLDSVFSTALRLASPPVGILIGASFSVLVVACIATFMGFSLIDGSLHPETSPFQSRLAHTLNISLVKHIRPLVIRLRVRAFTVVGVNKSKPKPSVFNLAPWMLSLEAMNMYHEVLQATGDDDILDDASAALFHVISQRTTYHATLPSRFFRRRPIDLLTQECATLLHLLSPEASVRSHRTAAQVIVNMATSARARPLRYSQNDIGRLLPSLARAARRASTGASLADLWESEFLRAMAIVANSGINAEAYRPAILFLNCEHWDWKYLSPTELTGIFALVFEVIDDKMRRQLMDPGDPGDEGIVDALLSDLEGSKHIIVKPRNILASLLYVPEDARLVMGFIISWLLRVTSPAEVITGLRQHIQTIQRSEWLHLVGFHQYAMVPRVVSSLAEHCLNTEKFGDRLILVELCTTCLLHTPNIRSMPPSGFVFFARRTLSMLLRAMAPMDLSGSESTTLLRDVLEIRRIVKEDLLWKDGKIEVLQEFDHVLQTVAPGAQDAFQDISQADESPNLAFSSEPDTSPRPLSPGAADYDAAEAGQHAGYSA